MSCFTMDQVMENNKALSMENEDLREKIKVLNGDIDILKKNLTLSQKDYAVVVKQCSEYENLIKCRERELKELGEINASMSEEISKLKRPLTVDTLLKTLSKNGANSVMIGLK